MKRIDRFGTIAWSTLEIIMFTLAIFALIGTVLPTSTLTWTIVEYAVSLLIAVLINHVWLPIEYRTNK